MSEIAKHLRQLADDIEKSELPVTSCAVFIHETAGVLDVLTENGRPDDDPFVARDRCISILNGIESRSAR